MSRAQDNARLNGTDDPLAYIQTIIQHYTGTDITKKTLPQIQQCYQEALWIETRTISVIAQAIAQAFAKE